MDKWELLEQIKQEVQELERRIGWDDVKATEVVSLKIEELCRVMRGKN